MFLVQCKELRINHLTLLLVLTMPYACWFLCRVNYIEDLKWRLRFQFGVVFWTVVLGEVYFEGPNCIWRALKTSILNIAHENLSWSETFSTHYRRFVCSKVEGAKINTSPTTNTYKPLPIANTLLPWIRSRDVGVSTPTDTTTKVTKNDFVYDCYLSRWRLQWLLIFVLLRTTCNGQTIVGDVTWDLQLYSHIR